MPAMHAPPRGPAAPSIAALVRNLPEVYQPIFGHPEFDASASRACDERLDAILPVLDALPNRGALRVLDLGCAQGYFALSLLERGVASEVVGIDKLGANVELCQALAGPFEGRARFLEASLSPELIASLGSFDAVLGLSVLHHIAHEEGLERAVAIVQALAASAGLAFLELALKEENLYWSARLPQDFRELLRPLPFWRTLRHLPTHLGSVRRPLVVASARHVLVAGRLFPFDEHLASSHEFERGVHVRSRRYFLSRAAGTLCKQYDKVPAVPHNASELSAERAFLERYHGEISFVPRLLAFEETADSVLLVREAPPGVRLSQLITGGTPYDADQGIDMVVSQLAELEKHGLFHNDLRTWNVLVDLARPRWTLIDFGSISSTQAEPPFEAFVAFCYAALTREQPAHASTLWPRLTPELFPPRYRPAIEWIRRTPPGELSFRKVADWLRDPAPPPAPKTRELDQKVDMLHAALERTIHAHLPRLATLERALDARVAGAEARLGQAEGKLGAAEARSADAAARTAVELDELRRAHASVSAELAELRQSIAGARQACDLLRADLDLLRDQVTPLVDLKRQLRALKPLYRALKTLKLL